MLRFFFDVDGVLLNFEKSYVRVLKDYFKLDIPDDFEMADWFFKDVLDENQLKESWEYFIGSEHFSRLSPLINPERFNSVFGAYPVHFITNIPRQYLETRKQNLKNAGFHWHSLHCGGMVSFDDNPPVTKAEIIRQLARDEEVLIFVDDHPDNCMNVHEHFSQAKVWLISRPFNQHFTHSVIRRADHWDTLIAFSKDLINAEVNHH